MLRRTALQVEKTSMKSDQLMSINTLPSALSRSRTKIVQKVFTLHNSAQSAERSLKSCLFLKKVTVALRVSSALSPTEYVLVAFDSFFATWRLRNFLTTAKGFKNLFSRIQQIDNNTQNQSIVGQGGHKNARMIKVRCRAVLFGFHAQQSEGKHPSVLNCIEQSF